MNLDATCLPDGVCAHVRRQLEGEALAFWLANEAELRELSRVELEAFARPFVHLDAAALPTAVALRLSVAWRRVDLEGWRAWRASTTASLQGVARRRAQARALLLEAVTRTSGVVLRVVGAVLRARLGL